jgi:hypothetical protein
VGLCLYFGFMFVLFSISPCGLVVVMVLVLLIFAVAVATCGVLLWVVFVVGCWGLV